MPAPAADVQPVPVVVLASIDQVHEAVVSKLVPPAHLAVASLDTLTGSVNRVDERVAASETVVA